MHQQEQPSLGVLWERLQYFPGVWTLDDIVIGANFRHVVSARRLPTSLNDALEGTPAKIHMPAGSIKLDGKLIRGKIQWVHLLVGLHKPPVFSFE